MSKFLLPTLIALSTAALVGPVAAQNGGPMVPSATPGNGPVMPSTPAQPMPMPGSTNTPMIPQTMPGTSATSNTPMPMPGTTEPNPTKPTILISVTIVDAPPGFPSRDTNSPPAATGVRDDLRAARTVASGRHVVLSTVAGPSITTLSDVPATLTTGTAVPYSPKPSDPAVKGQKAVTLNVGDTLTATPHINPDGTVMVNLSFTQTHLSGTSWPQIGPPQTETHAFTSTKTFHSGETLFLGQLAQTGGSTRLLFAAATVLTPGTATTLTPSSIAAPTSPVGAHANPAPTGKG